MILKFSDLLLFSQYSPPNMEFRGLDYYVIYC